MLGIPNTSLYDSTMRHIVQSRAGLQDEDHLAAALTNIAFLIYNRENRLGGVVPITREDVLLLKGEEE